MVKKKISSKKAVSKGKEDNLFISKKDTSKAVEIKSEVKVDPVVEKTPKVEKQHEMFYNLEEGRINLEDQEREKAAWRKAKELEAKEQERAKNVGNPKLTCPFCQHEQYELNSKDSTTSWCMNCGRAFMVNWE